MKTELKILEGCVVFLLGFLAAAVLLVVLSEGTTHENYHIVTIKGMTCIEGDWQKEGLTCDWSEYKGE